MGRRGRMVLLFTCLISATGGGQNLVMKDSLIITPLNKLTEPGIALVNIRFNQDLEFSLTCSSLFFLNRENGSGKSQASLMQYIRYRATLNNARNFTFSTTFVHNLGLQIFFDSISRFQPDENTLDTRIELRFLKNTRFSLLSNVTTRLFNAYDYSSGQSGTPMKTLNASFLTPLLCTFSAGVTLTLPRFGTVTMGLSSAKFTMILNKQIYEQLGVTDFYGVPKDKGHLFEYGLSLHLLVDRNFMKRVQWNCDVLVFKNYKKPFDIIVKNLVGIRITRFLKTSIQTRLIYERETSKRVQIENLLSLGFYFTM